MDPANIGMTQDAASDKYAAQDGHGDPNLSAISPPFPQGLVEPKLQGFFMLLLWAQKLEFLYSSA